MYLSYFGLDAPPFSIVPDHRAMYMSHSHREAVAHLLYALNQSGGFVQLTGEVGTGKTTVSRYILANLPDDVDVALLLNPRITEKEMLETICDELGIKYAKAASQKDLISKLNDYLLKAHSNGRKTVLIIDEAQNLSREVLEQIRLLTNLETSTEKLLQIVLIGQPELTHTLQRHDLRQLSQRIVGRFKLEPLNKEETKAYIEHRLKVCGVEKPLFTDAAISRVHKFSKGIPRVINILCDRALLGAFGQSKDKVDRPMISQAGREVLSDWPSQINIEFTKWIKYAGFALIPLIAYAAYEQYGNSLLDQVTDQNHKNEKSSGASSEATDSNADLAVPESTNEPSAASGSAENTKRTILTPYDLTFRLGVPLTNSTTSDLD